MVKEGNPYSAFLDAWEAACSCYSRSVLKIPAGRTYLVKPADFGGPCQSKVTLLISGNIIAPKDPEIWDGLNPTKWLYFHGVDHLSVGGGGTINGMGQKWWDRSCKIHKTNVISYSPEHVGPLNSKYMLLDGELHSAQAGNSHAIMLQRPNTDAIHISSSKQVEVRDTKIETELKYHHLCQFKVSSLSENLQIVPTHLFLSDEDSQGGSGFARDITFQNIAMVNVSNPIIIDQYYCDSLSPCPNQSRWRGCLTGISGERRQQKKQLYLLAVTTIHATKYFLVTLCYFTLEEIQALTVGKPRAPVLV
ncbi:hypothetical protein ACLOJK_031983 [Asimina triloba]